MKKQGWITREISRRAVMRALGGLGIISTAGLIGCVSKPHTPDEMTQSPGLAEMADRRGKEFGVAVQSWQIDDPEYSRALKVEANLIVPETELKWDSTEPQQGTFDFQGYRRLADFANGNGIDMRGHVLVWHHSNPPWLEQTLASCTPVVAEKIMRVHFERLLAETADSIRNWDVVNEPIDPHSSRPDFLRETLWLKAMGPDYISRAFGIAYDFDSKLTLVLNEFGLEYDDTLARAKRRAFLRLLIKLHKERVQVHAVGLQSHLQAHRPLGGQDFVNFLREVRKFGLNVYVTELDVDTSHVKASKAERDSFAQTYVAAYLDMIDRSGGDLDMVLTWGLTDRYSWLRQYDHTIEGALPLDLHMKRGPLWETLRTAWLGD